MARDYFDALRDQVEREVMACIGCNDCLLACPLPEAGAVTIAELNFAVLAERVTAWNVIEFVNACTQCQQCVPVCPADLHRADIVLWNKLRVEDVEPDREIPLQVGADIEGSGWTLDALASHLAGLPLFQDVAAQHLRRVLMRATLRYLSPGEALCREGEFHERLFVVLAGAVEQTASSDRGVERILVLGPGSFHGEMAVMGNQQEPFTVTAIAPSTVVELPKATVYRLMQQSAPFKATMDELYRRRALWTHTRSSPLLSALPEAAVDELLSRAAFRILSPGEVVYREGDPPGDLHLVRAGFLRVARAWGASERVLQYLRQGDTFGGVALLFRRAQSTTVSANTRSEIITIPGGAVADLLRRDPSLTGRLTEEAFRTEEIAMQAPGQRAPEPAVAGASGASRLMSLEGLLDQGVVQGHEVLVIDTSICTNCNNCVDACERRHGYARLERRGLQLGSLLFPSACRHCEDPVCLLCSVNGIVREPNGEIRIVPDSCIGCGACAARCPYGNIQMHDRDEGARDAGFDLFALLTPWKRASRRGEEPGAVERDRIAVKCDLCAGYGYYACVHACPVGAAMRIDPVAAFGRSDLLIGLEMKDA